MDWAVSWFWRALAAAWLVFGVACFVIGEDCVREWVMMMMMICLIAADIDDVKKGSGL